MKKKPIGVGLIGLGLISRAHIMGYRDAKGEASIIAVCDSNMSVAEAAAKNLGARAYSEYKALLRDPEIDLVDVTLPHNLHYEVAKAAIEAHKHVVVEKPMAVKSEQCRELINLSNAAKVAFTVAENTPFVLAYREVENLIRRQELGVPRLIRTLIYGSEVERLKDTSNWKGRASGSCGGVIIDAGPHSFYLLKWLFGEISSVQASSTKLIEESEVEDHAIVAGRMKNGAIFSTEYTFTAEIPWGERLEIYGSEGSLIVDQLSDPPVRRFLGKTDTSGQPVLQVPYDPTGWKLKSISRGVCDFVKAIRDNRAPTIAPWDGYYAVRIAEIAYQSITHSGVLLPVEEEIPNADRLMTSSQVK